MVRDGLIIFNSIHKVMRAESILKNSGVDQKIMPVPRELSSDCGLSITFPFSELEGVKELLEREGCVPDELHRESGGSYQAKSW